MAIASIGQQTDREAETVAAPPIESDHLSIMAVRSPGEPKRTRGAT
jgi:hypothetical protein